MASLTISDVHKTYGTQPVLHGIDLTVEDGDFVVFVGPSGCGKSTLLRMIAGLEDITSGSVSIDGLRVNDVAPAKRGVAMVFQTYALYPHMSVYKNMAFGLRQAKTPADEIDRRVKAAADILQITDYLDRSPRNLSGGQRQRVAIGRAIVRDPKVFLFDEPLSNLDASLRVQTRIEISKLHERLGSTMIYVTHDQVEAMTLADKIVVLKDGRIEQIGSPTDLYDRPQNLFVAGFIGSPKMNFFDRLDVLEATQKNMQNKHILGIRPEHLVSCDEADACVSGKLELIENLGEYVLAHMVGYTGATFIAKMDRNFVGTIGDSLTFKVNDRNIHWFNRTSTQRV
jgi:multiple sugar transport system ATP-binding protein/alpha-glucoside transport system ATP-binding protein